MQQPFTEQVTWRVSLGSSHSQGSSISWEKTKPLSLFRKGANVKQGIISYERIWVGDLAVGLRLWWRDGFCCADGTVAHTVTHGDHGNKTTSEEAGRMSSLCPKQRDEWRAESFAGAQKIWFTLSRNLIPSLRGRGERISAPVSFRHPWEIRSVNLFLAFTVGKSDASTKNEL